MTRKTKKTRKLRKVLLTVCCAALLVCVTIGATVAYLTDSTQEIKNTFTVGNVDISLAETTSNYKMVPSQPIDKDPTVTVEAGSEACWLFVKIEESANLDNYISYDVAEGWTKLNTTPADTIYYRSVDALTAENASDAEFSVLADDKVTVNSNVTKEMMDALGEENAVQPTLTFTAAAVQQAGFASAQAAWAQLPADFRASIILNDTSSDNP